MTGDAKHAVKEELEVDLDGPISALNRKPLNLKKEAVLIPKDERDNDNTPLALSKSLKKKPSISPKLNKQKPDKDDEDEKPLKKKEVLVKKSMSNSVKKELDSEKSRKRKRMEEKTKVKVKKESVSQEMSKSGKKEKKQYQLPGQKHESPEMRDPLRIFYETLYEKVPTSEMAATCSHACTPHSRSLAQESINERIMLEGEDDAIEVDKDSSSPDTTTESESSKTSKWNNKSISLMLEELVDAAKSISLYLHQPPKPSCPFNIGQTLEKLGTYTEVLEDDDFYDFAITYLMDVSHREMFMYLPEDMKIKWLRNRYTKGT